MTHRPPDIYAHFKKVFQTINRAGKSILFLEQLIRNRYGNKKILLRRQSSSLQSKNTASDIPALAPRVHSIDNPGLNIAVVCHLFHDDLASEFVSFFLNIPFPFDLYISTHESAVRRLDQLFSSELPHARVSVQAVENRGRDMAPFCVAFRGVYPRYDLVCWVHSKKSEEYNEKLGGWRLYLLDSLMGSRSRVCEILKLFEQDPLLGVLCAHHFPPILREVGWGANFSAVSILASRMGIPLDQASATDFPSGGMFWFRPQALSKLFNLRLSLNDFERGSERKIDGTLAHAIERLIILVARQSGYSSVILP